MISDPHAMAVRDPLLDRTPPKEWMLLLVLASIQFTHIVDFMMIMPLGPQFMRVFSISPQEFGLLVSVYAFSAGACGFIAALHIDRFDRKTSLMALYTSFTLATLACALAPGYWTLVLARSVAGLFGGILAASIFSIIGDSIPEWRRGAATGTVLSSFSLAAVAGVPIGLFLANHFGWRAPFLLLAILSTAILVLAWRVLPSMRTHLSCTRETKLLPLLRVIFSNRNHLNAFALAATLRFAGFLVIPFISPYMVANVGLTEHDLPYLYLSGGLMTLFTARLIGKLADRYGKRRIFTLVAGISIVPILVLTNLPKASVPLAVLVSTVFMIFVSGRFIPALAMVTSSVETKYRGSVMNFNSSMQQIATGLAIIVAGLLIGKSDAGTLTNYWAVGVIAAMATILCIALAQRLQVLPAD